MIRSRALRRAVLLAACACAGGSALQAQDLRGTVEGVVRSEDGGQPVANAMVASSVVAASYPVIALYGDSVAVAWSQTTAAEHQQKLAAMADMKNPKAVMPLPRVAQSEILMRTGAM
jgi:hypothetical protein